MPLSLKRSGREYHIGFLGSVRRQTKPITQGNTSVEAVYRTLITLFTYPELIGWSCLVLALLFLFIRLGLSDDHTLGLWISSDTLWLVNVFTDVLQDGHSLSS